VNACGTALLCCCSGFHAPVAHLLFSGVDTRTHPLGVCALLEQVSVLQRTCGCSVWIWVELHDVHVQHDGHGQQHLPRARSRSPRNDLKVRCAPQSSVAAHVLRPPPLHPPCWSLADVSVASFSPSNTRAHAHANTRPSRTSPGLGASSLRAMWWQRLPLSCRTR
jgi:hypothetical protein